MEKKLVMPRIDLNLCKFNIALFLRAILLLSPILLLFYQENGLSVNELFLFQGIFYLTSIIVETPVGYLSDNMSRRNLLILSFIIFISIAVLWFFYHGYWIILIGEMLFAVSKVMMDNAMSGYLYDYLTSKGESTRMVNYYGYLNFYLALGTAFAALLGTYFYAKFGSHFILISEFCLVLVSIFLVLSIPNIKRQNHDGVQKFFVNMKAICSNKAIIYYILYSGILTSYSILFALSFQPLMQNAMFPVMLFGVAAFFNHGLRALAGVVAGGGAIS